MAIYAGEWVPVPEAAKKLGKTEDQIMNLVRLGELRSVRTREGVKVWIPRFPPVI